MADQAERLRTLAQQNQEPVSVTKPSARIITITSGKGGVGKTSITTNLALLLARLNKKVLILDADLGLANVHVLLGINPEFTLQHVVYGHRSLADIVIKGPHGLQIIPGGSGIVELANLGERQRKEIVAALHEIAQQMDVVLIDTSPGLSRNVTNFALAADEVWVITTPEPTSITDAYAAIKVLSRENSYATIKLLVNMVQDEEEAMEAVRKIEKVARQFLKVPISGVGFVPTDRNVPLSVKQQNPYVLSFPYSPATSSLKTILGNLGYSTG